MQTATSYDHNFTLPENAENYAQIEASYKQGGQILIKLYKDGVFPDGMTFDGKVVRVVLSPQETKLFRKGDLTIHVRVLDTEGLVHGSQKWIVPVEQSNNEDVLK